MVFSTAEIICSLENHPDLLKGSLMSCLSTRREPLRPHKVTPAVAWLQTHGWHADLHLWLFLPQVPAWHCHLPKTRLLLAGSLLCMAVAFGPCTMYSLRTRPLAPFWENTPNVVWELPPHVSAIFSHGAFRGGPCALTQSSLYTQLLSVCIAPSCWMETPAHPVQRQFPSTVCLTLEDKSSSL